MRRLHLMTWFGQDQQVLHMPSGVSSMQWRSTALSRLLQARVIIPGHCKHIRQQLSMYSIDVSASLTSLVNAGRRPADRPAAKLAL